MKVYYNKEEIKQALEDIGFHKAIITNLSVLFGDDQEYNLEAVMAIIRPKCNVNWTNPIKEELLKIPLKIAKVNSDANYEKHFGGAEYDFGRFLK